MRGRKVFDDLSQWTLRGFGKRLAVPQEDTPNVAIEHRLMHAETLAYMLHQLRTGSEDCAARLSRSYSASAQAAVAARMIEIPAGTHAGNSARRGCLAGTTSLKSIGARCRPSRLAPTKSQTESSSDLCAKADTTISASGARRIGPGSRSTRSPIRVFGSSVRASGSIGPCLKSSVAARLAGLRQPRGSRCLCAFCGMSLPTEAQFHRAAYGTPEGTERRIRGAMRLPMRPRQLRLRALGPDRGGELSRWPERLRVGGSSRQRLGVDILALCALPGL